MSTLSRQALGRTGLEVTTLGYGAMGLRGAPNGPEIGDDEAERVLNAVLNAGINVIDMGGSAGITPLMRGCRGRSTWPAHSAGR